MGLFTKDIKTMDDLFVHTLRDVYYAEKQIEKALPKMIEKASDPALKQALETHLRETTGQVTRLEKVFETKGVEPSGVTCEAIDGILAEAKSEMSETADDSVRDAALVSLAQAVEHYEICRYGTLATWANRLNEPEAARLLAETLREEEAADEKLTEIAKDHVNREAVA